MAMHDAKAAEHALSATKRLLQQCEATLHDEQKAADLQREMQQAASSQLQDLKSAAEQVISLLLESTGSSGRAPL